MTTTRWLLVVPAIFLAFATAVGLGMVATPVMKDLAFETGLAIDGAVAAVMVIVAGAIVAPRARFAVAVVLYVIGAITAWHLLGAEEVWPPMVLPLAGTYLGGAFGIAWVGARFGPGGLVGSTAIALGLAATLGGLAVGHSRRFANRGAWAIVHTTTASGDERKTWVYIGSGSVPVCATIVDSDVARRRIEELIRVWWANTYPAVVGPSPDLTGHVPIRLSEGDCADRG